MVASLVESIDDFLFVDIKQQQKTMTQRTNIAKTTAPMTMPAMAPLDNPLLLLVLLLEVPPVDEAVPVLHRAVAAQFGVVDVGIQTNPMQPACVGGIVYAVPVSSSRTGPIH